MRGPPVCCLLKVAVDCPNVPSVRLGSGFWKFGWLNRLKKLASNLRVAFSVSLKVFFTPKSVLKKLGPTSVLRSIWPRAFPWHHKPMLTLAGQGTSVEWGPFNIPHALFDPSGVF